MSKYGPATPAAFRVVLSGEDLRKTYAPRTPTPSPVSYLTYFFLSAGTGQKSLSNIDYKKTF